jgi:Rrf2 family protein
MRITTWAEYGMIVSVHLARRVGAAAVSARDVAECEGLPADYVEQILLKLRRAGLVSSVRGAKGGYLLARDPSEVSVRDVVEATEERTFEVNCDARQVSEDRCAPGAGCSIRPVWRALQRRIDDLLESVTLGDLLGQETDVEEIMSATPVR